MYDQHPIGSSAHIELDCVASQRCCQVKCVDRVLASGTRRTAMGEYLYHRYPPSLVTMSENMAVPLVNGRFVS